MDTKKNQNSSMFLYTALIFAVALILIILAFFGQTNLSHLRKNTEQGYPNTETITEQTEITQNPAGNEPEQKNEDIAKMTNTISALDSENKSLKNKISTYDNLLAANSYLSTGEKDKAQLFIDEIDEKNLTDDQKILYDQITNKINEWKEH